MIIDNVKLPADIERGVEGGPLFNTVVLPTDGGNRFTNQEWSLPLYMGQVAYGIQSKASLKAARDFFWARRGRLRGFLFKDWSDFELTAESIGTGDGVEDEFQIVKHYPDSIIPFIRPITRPIESSLVVSINGSPISSSLWDLNTGGIIDFVTPPTLGQAITISGEFDIPVAFDTDKLTVRMETYDVGQIPDLPIIEIRE